jgi:hypothetical protein
MLTGTKPMNKTESKRWKFVVEGSVLPLEIDDDSDLVCSGVPGERLFVGVMPKFILLERRYNDGTSVIAKYNLEENPEIFKGKKDVEK